ncbi:MAG TPA: glycosyl hydrolase family 17 protein [Rhizomicrobium sp.]
MKRVLLCILFFVGTLASAGAADDLATQGWHGNAIAYSGYRAGQHPDLGRFPSPEQVLEDLRILEKNWKYIRVYSADRHAEDVLEAIRREKIGLKVMLGVWLDGRPDRLNGNSMQIVSAVRLANEYPDIVVAVNVGNEALVSWSDHRLAEPLVLSYVAQVKAAVRCPVTVADDLLYWYDPAAKLVGAVDFITMHAYPVWNGEDIDTAMASTIRIYEAVRAAHPDKTIVIGEAGWPTFTDSPENAPGAGSEAKQLRYYQELNAWAKAAGVTVFVFEAFDEPWKGSGTEGHWGLFSEARKAKAAMRELYPERSAEPSPEQSSSP